MAITDGFDLLKNVVYDTQLFNVQWLISLIVIILILVIITRDINKWKILLLPVTIATHIIGIIPSTVVYVIGAILFTIELLSLESFANNLSSSKSSSPPPTSSSNTGGFLSSIFKR